MPHTVMPKRLREYDSGLLRFQPIGLLKSKCFVQSAGSLRCTTCHNPHESVHSQAKETHIENCLSCHTEGQADVHCPVSPSEKCIECHMPATYLDDVGTEFHDHWIRVHEE